MTRREYHRFQMQVNNFMTRGGLVSLTQVDQNAGGDFSWHGCDCCGSRLGQDLYNAYGYNRTTKEIQDCYHVCDRCIYYMEYGQLDDMTMIEIGDNAKDLTSWLTLDSKLIESGYQRFGTDGIMFGHTRRFFYRKGDRLLKVWLDSEEETVIAVESL